MIHSMLHCALLCPALCSPMDGSSRASLENHVHQISDAIQPSHPLSPPLLLPSVFPSIRVFSNESVFHMRWPKYLSFSFSISPSNEYSELISFRIDWFDLLAVQGTLESSTLGDLPNPGTGPRSPALQVDSLPFELPGKPHYIINLLL